VIERARGEGMEVREDRVARDRLERASGLFLTNSLIGLWPVEALDGVAVRPHPGRDTLVASLAFG